MKSRSKKSLGVFSILMTVVFVVLGLAVAGLAQYSVDDSGRTVAAEGITLVGALPPDVAPHFNGIITATGDTPTGTSYMLTEHHGGDWADAEKIPPDDGGGNPLPDNGRGDEDDYLCWALAASNILEWTGWGIMGGQHVFNNSDEIGDYFTEHVTDYGSMIPAGVEWWFSGDLPYVGIGCSEEDVEGGNFWSGYGYTYTDYLHTELDDADTMEAIDTFLHEGWGTGIAVFDGGHAITVWGFNYDPNVAKATNPHDYYLGIWVTDSDDDKTLGNPPDSLRYYEVKWDTGNGWWYLPNLYGDYWHISEVDALEPFPGDRPVADAGGPYTVEEGSAITFSASGSTGNNLEYRWDFNNDRVWDTAWHTMAWPAYGTHTWNDDYWGFVKVEVWSIELRDVAMTTVTVINVAPVVDAGADALINEGVTFLSSGNFTDPGADTWNATVNYGDGTGDQPLTLSGKDFSLSHVYTDNGLYTVTVTVTDDDGGSGSDTVDVTVGNLPPVVNAEPNVEVFSGEVVSVNPTFSDPGVLDTHTAIISWGDGSLDSGGTVTESKGSGSVTGGHLFLIPGYHTVTVTVKDKDGVPGSNTFVVTVKRIPITIDIKPGSSNNSIQSDNNGVIPVAILTTSTFDARTVKVSTVEFGRGKAKTSQYTIVDVDRDRDLDLMLQFKTKDCTFKAGDTSATVTAQDTLGRYLIGTDVVYVLPKAK